MILVPRPLRERLVMPSRQRGFFSMPGGMGAARPSGGAASDPNYSSVTLLLHGEGSDGSTTFTDNSPSPKTVTAVGGAQIDTGQFKFGAASILFDGAGDYLTSASNAGFQFGTGALTIETFIRFNTVAACGLFSSYSDANAGFIVSYTGTVIRSYAGGTFVDRTWSPSTNTWYHFAISRAAGTTYVFIDGTLVGTSFADVRNWTPTIGISLQIGRTHTVTNDFNGHLDEIRITKGVGRYTANFTPPVAAFPNF